MKTRLVKTRKAQDLINQSVLFHLKNLQFDRQQKLQKIFGQYLVQAALYFMFPIDLLLLLLCVVCG